MRKFEREERYIVVKLKDLNGDQENHLRCLLDNHDIPTRECVVVESDWPEYEPVWDMIERRVTDGEQINKITYRIPGTLDAGSWEE